MIASTEFDDIIDELARQPLETNKYRKKCGEGRSQTFGIVNRRCIPPDFSRQCWKRAYLYKLLLDFADKYVTIPYNAITVNQCYKSAPHKDKGNTGQSFLIAFGPFEGGSLKFGDASHNVKYTPMIADFSNTIHSVEDFTGDRYSLVFYTLDIYKRFKYSDLPSPSVKEVGGRWVFH